MSQYDFKPEYERNLPHIQPPGAILFVTFRLAGSIPKEVLEQLKMNAEEKVRVIRQTAGTTELPRLLYDEQKRQFGRFDNELDKISTGPLWLRQPEIAEIMAEALHFRESKVYDLDVFCIMPNHVHAVINPLEKEEGEWHALQTIMHSLKRRTAREANNVLGREGTFWQHESYDHVIRNRSEWEKIVTYILNNPVKAGLVESWEDWPWTYLKDA
jgi:REP element-mobilizing transposase RayT